MRYNKIHKEVATPRKREFLLNGPPIYYWAVRDARVFSMAKRNDKEELWKKNWPHP
jgi:hypothetical protein